MVTTEVTMSNNTEAAPELSDQTRQHLLEELESLAGQRGDLGSLGNDDGVADSGDAAEQIRRIDDATRIDDRIKEIKRLLAGGSPSHGAANRPAREGGLADGSVVTLRFDDGDTETLYAAAIPEAVPDEERARALSLDSPLGQALADSAPGDTITYEAPDGEHQAEVLDIESP
jgi:transcription elongation GreA/GreB family factor